MDVKEYLDSLKKRKKTTQDTNNKIDDYIDQLKNRGKIDNAGKTPLQKASENLSAYKKWQNIAENQGFVPKGYFEKNFWGKLGSMSAFPMQKIFSGLQAFPRAAEASITSRTKDIIPLIIKERQAGKTGTQILKDNPYEMLKAIYGTPKDLAVWGKALVNRPGEYQNYTGSQMYKDTIGKALPQGKFTKDFKFSENTDDWIKGTNWIQKMGSGFAGSPADIAGLATDILLDPLTYITGGVSKGANTGLKATESLVAKGGKTILPKGSMIALTKTGKDLLLEAENKIMPKAIQGLKELTETGSTKLLQEALPNIVLDANSIKLLKGITKPAQANFLRSTVYKQVLKDTLSQLPIEEAAKYIDYGGLKVLGETVIPGYKLAGISEKAGATKAGQTLQGLFYTSKNMPEDYKYVNKFVKSLMQNREKQGAKLLADITKGKNQKSLDKIRDYGQLKMDIERFTKKLDDLQNKSTFIFDEEVGGVIDNTANFADDIAKTESKLAKLNTALDDLSKTMTPDELNTYGRYQTEFAQKFLKEAENLNDITYKSYNDYMPIRDMTEKELNSFIKRLEVGTEVAAFEKEKVLDYLQMKAANIKPGTLQENSLRRIQESAMRIGRSRLTNEVKQFGSMVKEAGLVPSKLTELKGWYFPEQIVKAVENTKQLFFGEQAFNTVLKSYDKLMTTWKRLALATPGYHIRNLFSDTFSGVMEYGQRFLNPSKWQDAIKIKMAEKGSEKARKTILSTKAYGGRSITAGEVVDEFLESGVMGGGMYYREALAAHGLPKKIDKASPLEWSTKIGGHREDLGRIVSGLIEKESGSNALITASNIKKIFFDYTDLTPTEQNVFRRFIMPFYSWNKKNLLRQFELMITKPGKYAAIPKTLNFIEDISETPEGYEENKPDYYKELGYTLTPFKQPSTGKSLIFNPNLPFQGLSMLSPMQNIYAISPALKIIAELSSGKEIFSKKDLRADNITEAPRYLQPLRALPQSALNKMGLSKSDDGQTVYINNKIDYALRQIPTAYTLGRTMPVNEDKKPDSIFQILSTLAGIKFTPYDTEANKEAKINQEISKYQAAIRKLKALKILPEDYGIDNIKKELGGNY